MNAARAGDVKPPVATIDDSNDHYGPIDGNPIIPGPCAEAQQAYHLLKSLSERQRGLVLCWFCRSCNRYVPPGDHCHCANDE